MKDDYSANSLTTSPIHFYIKGWENVLFELGSERVRSAEGCVIAKRYHWMTVLCCLVCTACYGPALGLGQRFVAAYTDKITNG